MHGQDYIGLRPDQTLGVQVINKWRERVMSV